jgi:hypothetical protein
VSQPINSRYVAYARAHGETAEGMLEADQMRWRGGSMTGFTIWIDGKWREWCTVTGRSRSCLTDADHAAFDAWLDGAS